MVEPRAPLSVGTLVAVGATAIATLLALAALWTVPLLPRIKPAYWVPCAILLLVVAVVCWRITLPVILLISILCAIVAPALTLAAYLRVSRIAWKLAQKEPHAGGASGSVCHLCGWRHTRSLGHCIHQRDRSLQLAAQNTAGLLNVSA